MGAWEGNEICVGAHPMRVQLIPCLENLLAMRRCHSVHVEDDIVLLKNYSGSMGFQKLLNMLAQNFTSVLKFCKTALNYH